ncbi:unnamed protein product [Symbiodinium natans]|uniref:RING-type domain-containing protein n=1 Tax=Symbiodinium natans TaxID=878477 RepID=A0A812LW95_9DINO|nr:unnamed protein product [Symbiodinium natans]
MCWLCLRMNSDQLRLKNPHCRHGLCRYCLLTRRMLPLPQNSSVVCPLCHLTSDEPMNSSEDDKGFRILSLDGGGVRGLIEVLVLKRLEEVFAPLKCGRSNRHGPSERNPFVSPGGVAGDHGQGHFFSQPCAKSIPPSPMYETRRFEDALKTLLGNDDHMSSFSGDAPPYVFCAIHILD